MFDDYDDDEDGALKVLLAIGEAAKEQTSRLKTKIIDWNERREYVLAGYVLKHKAYIRTKEKKEDKWEKEKRDVFRHPLFHGCTPIDLSKKWERMAKQVLP
jgi:hypothetical protein